MGETITIRTGSSTDVIKVIERGPQGPQGAAGAGLTTLTQTGDMLYRDASGGQRLPIGTAGQILKVNAGATAPEWGAAPASGVSSVNGASGAVTFTIPSASSTTPAALGTAAVGSASTFARADHVHAMPTAANVGAAASTHASNHLAGTPGIAASYTGIGDNETFSEEVVIIANTAGTAGNSITLSFDGVDDVDTVLASWNAANPSNQATLDSGDGAQVPDNDDELTLSGGAAAIVGGSDPIFDQDLNTDNSVTFERAKIIKLLANQIGPRLILDNTAGYGEGAVDFYTVGAANSDTDNPSARWYVVDDGNYSAHQYFQTKETGSNGVDMITRLAVRTDGNVGIGVEQPNTTLDVAGNIALRDTDNEFAATFDVQSQLSDDVTLTIPDQSGTLAVVTDIPTTAGDVGAVAAGAITTSGLTQATARILGRTTASTGAVEEITIGSGLSLSAGELSATGGGSGGTKTYAVFTATDNQPPASNFATLDTRNSIAVLDFNDTTDESAVFVGIIPEGASLGSGLKVFIHWMASTATSDNCRWGVQFEKSGTDLDTDSFDTATEAHSAANGTSGIETVTEITATTIDSLAAGDRFRLKVFRNADDATNDTMTGDAELIAVEIRSAA
jgi:hypothetical protein